MDEEREACRVLARAAWGETLWRCPDAVCGGREAIQLITRPRTFQCCKCRRQRSVTAGTAFAHTKLPISKVVELVRACTASVVPTARSLAVRHRVAVSTAWHVVQRVLRVTAARAGQLAGQARAPSVQVDRTTVWSSGGGPLPPSAPAQARVCHAAGHSARLWFTVDGADGAITIGRIQPRPPPEIHDPGPGLAGLVAAALTGSRAVSLRWAPRWIGGLAGILRSSASDDVGGDWLAVAKTVGACPLPRLEPWS